MFVPELGCYPDDGAGAGPGGVGQELAQVEVVGASGLVLDGDDRAGIGVPGEDVEGEVADGDLGADELIGMRSSPPKRSSLSASQGNDVRSLP